MNKTAIIMDSTCYMSEEEIEKRGYKIIPLSVNFDNLIFKEKNDDGTQGKKVFKEIFESKKLPTTSQPLPQDIINTFQEAVDEGYNKIISLHISKELSGTTQGVSVIAKQFVQECNKDIQIEVISTDAAAQVSGIIVNEIDDIVKIYGDITTDEIQDIITHYTNEMEVFFFVDDLNFLHYGGRIPQAFAATGNILKLTPILTLSKKGKIEKYKIERSQKKGIKSILKKLNNENFQKSDDIILMTAHIQAEKTARKILKMAQESTDANLVKTEVSNMGIVIGNHLGPGAFGVGWVPKYKRTNK